jgi:hypothetical protein
MIEIKFKLPEPYATIYGQMLADVNGAVGPVLTQDQLAERLMIDWLRHYSQEDKATRPN